ncbi:DM13 domain-containing protein [Almyronema epifaneia]|uniref:DM13 domain-containing protein n=1 Tax=Almyronema epifaneia S1 TaxID=2991925 RepID=A0ABW6IF17_9CYAN
MQLKLFTPLGLTLALLIGNSLSWRSPVAVAETVEIAQAAPSASQFVTVDRSHPTTGSFRIVTENGQQYLEFDQQFSTGGGPDVEVILYRSATIPTAIAEADYVKLDQLQRLRGSQRYSIPADIDLDEYGSVGIWCRTFNITFGYAAL